MTINGPRKNTIVAAINPEEGGTVTRAWPNDGKAWHNAGKAWPGSTEAPPPPRYPVGPKCACPARHYTDISFSLTIAT